MGSSCPSQNIQPAGAKLPANMRISPTYGCAILPCLLCRARENALQGDTEAEDEERLHVQVGLAAADVADRSGSEGHELRRRGVDFVDTGGQQVATRNVGAVRIGVRRGAGGGVGVRGELGD